MGNVDNNSQNENIMENSLSPNRGDTLIVLIEKNIPLSPVGATH